MNNILKTIKQEPLAASILSLCMIVVVGAVWIMAIFHG